MLTLFSDPANYSVTYRLRSDEAVVFIGHTPPACKYFSYQSFQVLKYDPDKNVFEKIFGNLGDTINQLTIKTGGSDPFDKPVIIIVTYVYKVARHSDGDPHCAEVPAGPGAYGIGLDKEAFVGFRADIENQTKVGPSYTELVYDRVIEFSA